MIGMKRWRQMPYLARWSALFLLFISILALVAPWVCVYGPNDFDPLLISGPQAPSWQHLFGTDDFGRDIFARIVYGSRISLLVGIVSVTVSLLIGVILGLSAGFFGGIIDRIITATVDMVLAIPSIFLILIIQVVLTPSIINVMIVIGLTSWMGITRLVRAEVMSIKQRLFIKAANARGIPSWIILWKHILPHTLNPIIVAAMLGMGSAILTESVLSFLGLGVTPPNPSWGNMLQNSLQYIEDAPWMAIYPGVCITLTVLALNFLGDGIKEMLGPKRYVDC